MISSGEVSVEPIVATEFLKSEDWVSVKMFNSPFDICEPWCWYIKNLQNWVILFGQMQENIPYMEHVGLTLNMTNSVGLCPQFWPIELKRTYGTQLPKTHYYAHEPLKSVWLGLWVQGSESTISTNNSNSRRALSTLRVGK
jgi:hypothetical protein